MLQSWWLKDVSFLVGVDGGVFIFILWFYDIQFDVFKASALRPMLSISRDVRVCVCLSVTLSHSI